MLQGRVSHHSPFTQFLPPFIAAISMFLVRICSPCPQVTEQVLQFPNKLHVQLTKFIVKSNFWGIYNTLNYEWLSNAVVVVENGLTNILAKTIYAVLAASITSLPLLSAITIAVIHIAIWCCWVILTTFASTTIAITVFTCLPSNKTRIPIFGALANWIFWVAVWSSRTPITATSVAAHAFSSYACFTRVSASWYIRWAHADAGLT